MFFVEAIIMKADSISAINQKYLKTYENELTPFIKKVSIVININSRMFARYYNNHCLN